jgi:signal transduction histidine kinase
MQVQREQSNEEIIEALQSQVNELKASNLMLKEQLERREQFNAMIAHELRGPLTPIINYAELLARPNLKPEAVQRRTQIIISQARRLERIINDLHDASRLSTGQFTLDRSTCDVAALAREVVEQLSPLASYHKFLVEAPTVAITGKWDAGRLQQVLGNLLDNAIKYSDEGTTITVHISIYEQQSEPKQEQGQGTKKVAHVSVHNQGVSIPPAEIGQLFRPYGRLQSSAGHQGSGLGLYITKCIIEAHGGTLQLESPTPETSGTTFSFDLPM